MHGGCYFVALCALLIGFPELITANLDSEVQELKLLVKRQSEFIQSLQQQQQQQQQQQVLSLQQNGLKRDSRSDDISPLQVVVSELSQKVSDLTAQLNSVTANTLTQGNGAVYTRWGSSSCPASSQLVYSGVIGGASYQHSGGATNSLCLPMNPVYTTGAHLGVVGIFAGLYGTEYEVIPEAAHNRKPTCAVCMSSRPHVVMIPVTNVCPSGWTVEYTGLIMSELPEDGRSGTEYICVDASLGGLVGSEHQDYNEHVLYYTQTHCGSLPCPPFVDGQVALCVVCSR